MTQSIGTGLHTTMKITLAAAAMTTVLSTTALGNPVQTFYNNPRHTYCDAKLLAAYWSVTPYQAKADAGRMMERGQGRFLPGKLAYARRRTGVRCTFADANNPSYSYDDAVALARYWGYRTPFQAKGKVGWLLRQGRNIHIRRSLRAARGGRY